MQLSLRGIGMAFNHRQTNISKGVALLLLIWHHLFFNRPDMYSRFSSMGIFQGVPIECWIASFSKVCVAIFLLLSGYGMYISYKKEQEAIFCWRAIRRDFYFIKRHLLKQMFNYWFIFIIFVPIGIFFNRKISNIYENNILFGVLDFLGLSNIFSTPSANNSWWFVSLIIILYILFPLLARVIEWFPEWVFMFSLSILLIPNLTSLPIVGEYLVWLPPFLFGMILAKYSLLERIRNKIQSILKGLMLSLTLILFFAVMRILLNKLGMHTAIFDSFFSFSIVLFSYLVLSRVPFISNGLELLGKYSGDIYMFHIFITEYFFREQIYGFRYPALIFIMTVIICIIIALLLSRLKKVTRYNVLINNVLL